MNGQQIRCRLCAEYKPENDIMDVKNEMAQKIDLEYKIQDCFSLDFNNENLPRTVCLNCCIKVSEHYEFKELVKKSQDILLCYVKSELPENDFNYFDNIHDTDVSVKAESVKSEVSSSESPLSEIKKEIKKRGRKRKEKKDGDGIKIESDLKKKNGDRSASIKRTKEMWKNYKWFCSLCNEQMPSLSELRKHFTDFHFKSPQYLCNECSTVFDVFNYFRKHVAAHRDRNRFSCTVCGRCFHKKEHLKGHLETHSTDRKYICTECGKAFKTSSSFRSHVRSHSVVKLQFECQYCNKVLYYSSKAAWIVHQKKHQGIKDHICDHCGKCFLQQGTLKEHIQALHSDEKPYVCKHCGRTFKTHSNLNKHLQVHSDVRRHACEICGKRFHRKGTLDLHRTVHSDEKPFECEYCQKRFSRKRFLQVHIRQHTGERPYSCEDCNHHFSNSSNYIKHMRQKHGVQSIRKNVTYKIEPGTIVENNATNVINNTIS